jgi:hypothetical protein
MATLAFCRRFPERLGTRVAGLVLVNTTDLDPVRTTTAAGLFAALLTPLLTTAMSGLTRHRKCTRHRRSGIG